jgi:arylsulfatase A-like enzyme
MIFIDDMGWRDLGCFGSAFYETPNIDRLAAEGVRFSNAYATCPVCSPSRASVMTGKYPASVGITDWIDHRLKEGERDYGYRGKVKDVPYLKHLPRSEKTVATALREGGYAAWHVGKWHLGDDGSSPTDHGFEVNVAGSRHGHPVNGYFSPYGLKNLEDRPVDGEFLTDRLTDEAIALIKGHCARRDGRPFYLNFWHYAVHTPIMGKEGEVKRFAQKASRLKLDLTNPHAEGEACPTERQKNEKVRRRLFQSDAEYAALVYNLDQNVGRLMRALEEAGQAEDTIVIFSSDNGGLATMEAPTCNFPLAEGKGWMYDGGVRVPLIVKWPGRVEPNTINDDITTGADFYPTFLEAAGLAPIPEQHADGVSLVGALTRREPIDREAVFWHYPHYGNQGGTPGCAVRSGGHKLIEFFEDGHLELYDIRNDISESYDLADSLPDVRDRLYRLLSDWKDKVEAKIPEPNPDYIPG